LVRLYLRFSRDKVARFSPECYNHWEECAFVIREWPLSEPATPYGIMETASGITAQGYVALK
jgi:hypothetical protein